MSVFEENLQMIFGMLKYRKNKGELKTYLDENRIFFSDLDQDTYEAACSMLGFEKHLKNLKNEKGEGGVNMCQAVEEWYQESLKEGAEREEQRGMKVLIETCKEFQIPYKDTLKKLQEKYYLSDNEAENIMKISW